MCPVRIVVYVIVINGLFTSCELFNGDGNNKKGGEVIWSVKNQTDLLVGTQPLIQDKRAYFLQDGYLKAYSLPDGKQVWSNRVAQQGGGDYSRKIIQSGEKIFLDQGYNIKAFKKSNGSLVWNTRVTDNGEEVSGIGSPIMSQDEKYLYAGRDGYVLKLRKNDGEIVRRFELNRLVPDGVRQGSTEPIISPFGDNILYVPASYFDHSQPSPVEASGGNIFAFDATSGALVWERQITVIVPNRYTEAPGDSLTGSPMIYDISVTENKVIALAGFYIVALNRMTGEPIWKTYFSKGGFDVGLAVKGNGVYAASIGRFATRVDLENGDVIWQRDIKFSNTSIPTVTNGRMYFNNSGGGGIWVLDTEDGSVIYHENTPHSRQDDFDVYISSLGVGEGYMVNVGSKYVYCLTVP